MANTFLTVNEIAKESVMRLQNNLVMAKLVHTDYSNEFSTKGQTISIRKPSSFVANDFTGTTSTQNISESNVLVTLDSIADVTVEVSSKEMSLNIEDFGVQILDGAMQAIAQKIDSRLAGLYNEIPYYHGIAGTTPDGLDDFSGVAKRMNINKVPFSNRSLVIDPEAQAKMSVLDAIVNAEKSGSTQALREANIGKILGFDTYLDQNIYTHTKGTLDAAATGSVDVSVDPYLVTVAAGGNAKTVKKGDIVSFASTEGTYVVAADKATAADGS